MKISVTEAKAQLTDLVRRAESGEEIVLTRHGQEVAQISAFKPKRLSPAERSAAIDRIIEEAQIENRLKGFVGTSNHDDLYDEFGIPK